MALAIALPAMAGTAMQAHAAAWLGVYHQEITRELREGLNYNGPGVLVRDVVPGSPADRAGIERGDVIVRLGTRDVRTADQLVEMVQAAPAGRRTPVEIVREGRKRSLDVVLEERPESAEGGEMDEMAPPPGPGMRWQQMERDEDAPPAPRMRWQEKGDQAPGAPGKERRRVRVRVEGPEGVREFDGPGGLEGLEKLKDLDVKELDINLPHVGQLMALGRGRLGVRVESLSPDLASYFGPKEMKGALVLEVTDDSPAERAGIRAGDVITRLDEATIEDADDLVEAVRKGEDEVSITMVRHGDRQTVRASLGPRARAFHMDRFAPEGFSWNEKGPGGGDVERRIVIRGRDKADAPRIERRMRLRAEDLDENIREMVEELRQEMKELKKELKEKYQDED